MSEMYSREQLISMLRASRKFWYAHGVRQGYVEGRWGFLSINEEPIKSQLVKKALESANTHIPKEIKRKIALPAKDPGFLRGVQYLL